MNARTGILLFALCMLVHLEVSRLLASLLLLLHMAQGVRLRERRARVFCLDLPCGRRCFYTHSLPPARPSCQDLFFCLFPLGTLILLLMTTNTVPAPSQAQLALALAVVKLKPANVDVKGQTQQPSPTGIHIVKTCCINYHHYQTTSSRSASTSRAGEIPISPPPRTSISTASPSGSRRTKSPCPRRASSSTASTTWSSATRPCLPG